VPRDRVAGTSPAMTADIHSSEYVLAARTAP
jgi:hypothetical protein